MNTGKEFDNNNKDLLFKLDGNKQIDIVDEDKLHKLQSVLDEVMGLLDIKFKVRTDKMPAHASDFNLDLFKVSVQLDVYSVLGCWSFLMECDAEDKVNKLQELFAGIKSGKFKLQLVER